MLKDKQVIGHWVKASKANLPRIPAAERGRGIEADGTQVYFQWILTGSVQAVEGLEKVQAIRPKDSEVPMMLARIYHNLDKPEKAIKVLEQFIGKHPLVTEPSHVNVLAELYMDAEEYGKAVQLVERAADHICKQGLPIDLQVYHRSNKLPTALGGLQFRQKLPHKGCPAFEETVCRLQ